jgi:hypothetical protein
LFLRAGIGLATTWSDNDNPAGRCCCALGAALGKAPRLFFLVVEEAYT